jgi:hypothetical protein
MGDWPRATKVLEDFRANFPKHELTADVTAKLAVAYVEVGNSALAAGEFERIADADGSVEVKREALWRSAELYCGQRPKRAGGCSLRQVRGAVPAAGDRGVEARQKLVQIAETNGNQAERARWLKDIVTADCGRRRRAHRPHALSRREGAARARATVA